MNAKIQKQSPEVFFWKRCNAGNFTGVFLWNLRNFEGDCFWKFTVFNPQLNKTGHESYSEEYYGFWKISKRKFLPGRNFPLLKSALFFYQLRYVVSLNMYKTLRLGIVEKQSLLLYACWCKKQKKLWSENDVTINL